MEARLKDLIVEAEAKLGPDAQERLAEIVEAFVASWAEQVAFTADEMKRLREIDAEPFEEVDPGEGQAVLPAAWLGRVGRPGVHYLC